MNRYRMHEPVESRPNLEVVIGTRVKFNKKYLDEHLDDDIFEDRDGWAKMRGVVVGEKPERNMFVVAWDKKIHMGTSSEYKENLEHESL